MFTLPEHLSSPMVFSEGIVVLHIILIVKDQVSGNPSLTAKKSFKIRSRKSKKNR
jgi:hypothetical protein